MKCDLSSDANCFELRRWVSCSIHDKTDNAETDQDSDAVESCIEFYFENCRGWEGGIIIAHHRGCEDIVGCVHADRAFKAAVNISQNTGEEPKEKISTNGDKERGVFRAC